MSRGFVRRLSSVLLATCCGLFLALPVASARGWSGRTDVGTIAGTLVNGTRNDQPIAQQTVTLQLTIGTTAQDLTTFTTDSAGHFSFPNLDTSQTAIYAVYTRYEGGLYTSTAIQFKGSTSQQVTLTAYDATSSSADLHINAITALVRPPDPIHGLIGVGEFVSIHNSGTTAFVGNAAATSGMPTGLLLFALPVGASNLVPGVGFVGAQITQVNTGFGATATVPPGDTIFAFAFDMPYNGTQVSIPFQAVYGVDAVTMLVPTTLRANGDEFSEQNATQAFGTPYSDFQSGALRAGQTRTIEVTGLPAAGQPSDLNFGGLVALAMLLALVLAAALIYYLKRGTLNHGPLAWLAHMEPTPITLASPRSASPTPAHQALLHELLALERHHAKGRLDDETYRRHDGEVRAALRAVLAVEAAAAPQAESPSGSAESAASTSQMATPETTKTHTLSGGSR